MRARLAACVSLAAPLCACEAPPMLQIANAGPEAISVGVEWRSRTVQPGRGFIIPYSGRDFGISEGVCVFKYKGRKPASGQMLTLRWMGGGRLEGDPPPEPAGKRCAS